MRVLVVVAVTFYVCVALFSVYWGHAALTQPMNPPNLLCGVSEISPDFNHTQREQCRLLRRHKL